MIETDLTGRVAIVTEAAEKAGAPCAWFHIAASAYQPVNWIA